MAYAIQSLIQILEQDQHHLYLETKHQIQSLLVKAHTVRDLYVENNSVNSSGEHDELEIRIRDVAHRAEDIVESHIWSKIVSVYGNWGNGLDLTDVNEEMDSVREELVLQTDYVLQDITQPALSPPEYMHPSWTKTVVGFDTDISQLKDQITSYARELKIITIVGVGGSGKTALAWQLYSDLVLRRNGGKMALEFQFCDEFLGRGSSENEMLVSEIYDDWSFSALFEVHAWVTISKPFDLQGTLCALLYCLHGIPEDMNRGTEVVLGKHVYQSLKGMRYLIILDHICDASAWNKLRHYFPDDHNGSRIILTTREWGVVHHANSSRKPHQMKPIDEDASFELLARRVFGLSQHCPPVLAETTRNIARQCRGIPIAIAIAAKVLLGLDEALDIWKSVECRLSNPFEEWEEFQSVEEELLNLQADRSLPYKKDRTFKASLYSYPSWQHSVVGFDGNIADLVVQLTSKAPELQIIPIVGIGGSGKTTLAQETYNHLFIATSFSVRAWITISQAFDLRSSLLELLDCLKKVPENVNQIIDVDLGAYVYKSLMLKRYLIVVDDVWDSTVWDKVRGFFPDEQNSSRIILTTREWSLADYAKSSSNPYQMQPFNKNESFEFLIHKVFGPSRYCPPELVEVGRKIARNCKGIPLALATTAGLLCKSAMNVQAWKRVECSQLCTTNETEIQVDPYLKGIADLFSKDGLQLLDRLDVQQPTLLVIPIIGMRGSGKTTLAQLLYDRSLLSKEFDIHAWVASSHQQDAQSLLHNLLNSLGNSISETPKVNNRLVSDHVHKTLYQRRYLVVLDDIKDSNTWEMLRRFFPDNSNGSRIILTSREWNITDYEGIKPFRLDSYWEFLLQKAFEQVCCTPEAEISHVKVYGLCPMIEKTRIFWELLEKSRSSEERHIDIHLDLVSMTYSHLPHYLKPCFLYMGAFPEDCEIRVSKVVKLLVAEGLVSSTADESLEYTAETYVKDLIHRNLLFACINKFNGKVDAVKLHDVFWKFCQKRACEENFLWFKDFDGQNIPEDEEIVRRVSMHPLSELFSYEVEFMSHARSFLCFGPTSLDPAPVLENLKLLRVFDVLGYVFVDFPKEMLQLINLRYLAFTCHSALPSEISIFQNLETLVAAKSLSMPSELWGMTQLRHIKCKETLIWHYPDDGGCGVPENLQTLSNIPISILSEEFLRNFPNLRKLWIFSDALNMMNTVVNLCLLQKLESLNCSSSDTSPVAHDFLSYLTFPVNLKKLTLRSCNISQEHMSSIGSLPSLEELILQKCDFTNNIWSPVEGQFDSLLWLQMEDLNLVTWEVGCDNFPWLHHLVIRGCLSMDEIPLEVGEIFTLQLIEVDNCSHSLVGSALRILKEHRGQGNDDLRVVIHNA